ncbi:MAG: DegV family protein [Gemmatimonadota bacterium]
MKIAYLDGARFRRSLLAACRHTERQRGELNRINVFPVADGDTGTNLALTVRAIADELRQSRSRELHLVAGEVANAAVMGARGNSGMMLSHFLVGFSQRVGEQDRVTPAEFTWAMVAGVEALESAIERPVEGTILTVMRDTARAAEQNQADDFVPFLQRLVQEARESLDRTPSLLPALKESGVVDAGAKGFFHLLEGVLLLIHGELVAEGAEDRAPIPEVDGEVTGVGAASQQESTETYRYCTEALVRGDALPSAEVVKKQLRPLGDSLLAIRSGDILKVHIHADEPEEVFRRLSALGKLVTRKAEDMWAQTQAAGAAGHAGRLVRRPVSVVTESANDLPREVLQAHGIHVVPLLLIDGDEVLRDGVDISTEAFTRTLKEGGDLPTTSQPSPADILKTFEAAAQDGEAVVAVALSSGLSGTFASTEAAAARFQDAPVHLVDSRGASLLQGLLVLKAAELGEMGMPASEIPGAISHLRDRSGMLFTVDTFDRLLASGRVNWQKALLGRVMKIKPILELTDEGKVAPAGKVLGRGRVMDAMMDAMAARMPAQASRRRFGLVHVGRPEILEEAAGRIRDDWGADVEILTSPATSVLATHLGIGAWGVAWMAED